MTCSTCLRPFLIVFTCEDGKDRCFECKKAHRPVDPAAKDRRDNAIERAAYRELAKAKREYRGGKQRAARMSHAEMKERGLVVVREQGRSG